MRREDVCRVISEEVAREHNAQILVMNIRTHLAREVARHVLRELTSIERWELFVKLIRAEAFLLKLFQERDRVVVGVYPDEVSNMYNALFSSYEFLLKEYETTSELFQEAWPKDVISELLCTLFVERDMIIEHLEQEDRAVFAVERTVQFVDLARRAQTGLVGEVAMSDFVNEMNEALAIVREEFRMKKE